ncbi:DUF2142 domain-containing protein [Leifsonia sp. A12D58]|uniref:DUF2142 domain-containing protein n=1 Tax=Leifsonia sp. A12D58 TaxID=3397674 RepID=UPI0039DFE108
MTASAPSNIDSASADPARFEILNTEHARVDPTHVASTVVVSTSAAPVRAHRWKVFGASWAILSLLSIMWALATPISASPDEPAHIVKAASVARGQFIGETTSLGQVVQVPRYIAYTHSETCFAFHSDVSAACTTPLAGDPAEIIDAPTSAGLYNPVYYMLIGWPTLFLGDDSGIYVMRAISAILTSLFLACTIAVAYGLRRNAIPLTALAVAVPPMLLFLGGSVNPNAVEITATLAVFAAMLAIVTQPNPRLLTARAVVVMVGAAMAVNTRGLSPLWVAIAIVVPLLLLSWKQLWVLLQKRPVQWAVGVTVVATVFAVGWLLRTSSLTAMQDDPDYFQSFPGVGTGHLTGFVMTVRDTLGYAQGMIANFGWLDTPPPILVYFTWSAFVGMLLLVAFSILRGKALLVGGVLLAIFLFLPALIQGAYITNGGIIWQGRYTLPLFVMLVFGLAVLVAERINLPDAGVLNRLTFAVWAAWAGAQYLSFAAALKRYAVGVDGTWKNVIMNPEWSAPGGNLLWLVVFGLVLVGGAWAGWHISRAHVMVPESAPALPTPALSTPSQAADATTAIPATSR